MCIIEVGTGALDFRASLLVFVRARVLFGRSVARLGDFLERAPVFNNVSCFGFASEARMVGGVGVGKAALQDGTGCRILHPPSGDRTHR